MYNKEFLEFYEENKKVFERDIEEIGKMLKEVIGEENEGYFRLSQILRLIEYDYDKLLKYFGDLLEVVNESTGLLKELQEAEETLKKELSEKFKDEEFYKQDIDVLSEIVKNVNKLDEQNQRVILSYVSGMVAAKERVKNSSSCTIKRK